MALPAQIRSILIIQTAFTGDVVLATPVIERLHRCYPDAAIDFLLRKGNEGLLQGHPHLRSVLARDKKQGKLRSLLQTLRQVRAQRYDLVVNLHRFMSSGIVAALSGGRHVCGFDKNPFAWRYHHRVPHHIGAEAGAVHEVDRNLSVIAHLTDGPPDPMRLYPSAADQAHVPTGLAYVCIAPTSVWFTKQWPAARWVALIQALPPGLRVYLLGAPGDHAVCQGIAQASGHPDLHNMCGQLSFLQSAALMAHARMNYVNDSAPLHFASAMQAPVTAVFCSTVPAFGFGPRSARGRVVEHGGPLACRPCGLHGHRACPQGHFQCADIPTQAVLGEFKTD
jgi:heptosyltransferase II